MDQKKLQEAFSDKAYVESIVKLSPEEAAKSLNAKGVEVTAEDLVNLHDFIVAHKDELQNGELDEEALAEVAGGLRGGEIAFIVYGAVVTAAFVVGVSWFFW